MYSDDFMFVNTAVKFKMDDKFSWGQNSESTKRSFSILKLLNV